MSALTPAEREWIANALADTFTPYGRDFDAEEGARLLEARMATLLARTKADAWDEGHDSCCDAAREYHDPDVDQSNPYREES